MNAIDRLLADDRHSPRDQAVTPSNMSNPLAHELLNTIDVGDYELSDWETEFVGGNLERTSFSTAQKSVIYKMAKRFNLL
jgi:hypothetical protein